MDLSLGHPARLTSVRSALFFSFSEWPARGGARAPKVRKEKGMKKAKETACLLDTQAADVRTARNFVVHMSGFPLYCAVRL